ncbi:hnRNP-like protein, RNA recognition motif (RRM)-containing protein, partial [Chondrus crispus]
ETEEDSVRSYFARYGPVSDCVIMRDRLTGHPRGFGFVTYDDQLVAERVATEFHELDGRQVEAKIAVPRSECVPALRTNAWRATKKVFVGGLPATCREAELLAHFKRFGDVAECQVMYDHQTGNSRGFGFVTFTSEATVDTVVDLDQHEILAKHVEVKRAEPKQALEARRGREAAAAAAVAAAHQQQHQHHHQQQQQQHHPAAVAKHHTQSVTAHAPYAAVAATNSAASVPAIPSPPSASHSTPAAQSPFPGFGPWSSLFSSAPGASSGSSWSALVAAERASLNAAPGPSLPVSSPNSNATSTSVPAGGSSLRSPSNSGMGFFTPAQPYTPDLAQCVYNAYYGSSTTPEGFEIGAHAQGLPSARAERRFHPYPTRERVDRSYR